jgi:segregation and condensation protein A
LVTFKTSKPNSELENDVFQHRLDFGIKPLKDEPDLAQDIEADEALVVDLDGYEGPLHVLLVLARQQKVDLLKISITKLAEQYLAFIHEARKLRFSLAADYLVMASWLAYLKSRLLLPVRERKQTQEPEPEDMAQALAFRLKKLEAIRKAVDAITSRPQLKVDVFARGDPQARVILPSSKLDASLYELMGAYISQRQRDMARHYDPSMRIEAYGLEAARDHLKGALPRLNEWTPLDDIAPKPIGEYGPNRASYLASTLSAGLELTKEGLMQVQQLGIFETLYMRKRKTLMSVVGND